MFTDIRGDTTLEVRVAKGIYQFMLMTHDGRHRTAIVYLVQSTSAPSDGTIRYYRARKVRDVGA
jgi:hypothetical protein